MIYKKILVVGLAFINLTGVAYSQDKFKIDVKKIIPSSYIDFITTYDNIQANLKQCCGLTNHDYNFETVGNLKICKVPIYDMWTEITDTSKKSFADLKNFKPLEKLCLTFLYKENTNAEIMKDRSILEKYSVDPNNIKDFTQYLISNIKQNMDSSKYYWEFKIGSNDYYCMVLWGSKYGYSTTHTVPYYLDYDSARKNAICITDQKTKVRRWEVLTDHKVVITEDGIKLRMKKKYNEPEILKRLEVLNKFCSIAMEFKFYGITKEH